MATNVLKMWSRPFVEVVGTLKRFQATGVYQARKLATYSTNAATQKLAQQTESGTVKIQDPLQHPDYFDVHKLFTLQDLFRANVHVGHKTGLLNVHMRKYIFGVRQKICIIDLDKTVKHLQIALNFASHIAYRKGSILFINRSLQFTHLVEKTAKECGEFAQTRRWQGGCFTNSLVQYGPEVKLPDLVVFLNTQNNVFQEHAAVRDSAKMNIPTIGIVDTNCNPNLITYPVPGNDDTPDAMELYCRLFKNAILKAKQMRKEFDDHDNVM
uniref:28S ribosomal protein S2, mitochondrial-like n=1 Tax=Saccoglossus kowalevskii TaxID=10224 RepID=A0ABM0GQZ0_SACKO|nr:PREDICTED: 28S ribosomal protein S2, mitochondrial-like [Saccoglossus kowalevskii]